MCIWIVPSIKQQTYISNISTFKYKMIDQRERERKERRKKEKEERRERREMKRRAKEFGLVQVGGERKRKEKKRRRKRTKKEKKKGKRMKREERKIRNQCSWTHQFLSEAEIFQLEKTRSFDKFCSYISSINFFRIIVKALIFLSPILYFLYGQRKCHSWHLMTFGADHAITKTQESQWINNCDQSSLINLFQLEFHLVFLNFFLLYSFPCIFKLEEKVILFTSASMNR